MKKRTLTFLIMLAVSSSVSAQFNLQQGEDPFYQVVKRPYLFYDLMRYQQNAWIRQYRENTSQGWSNSNLLINRKDASGQFTYLEYSLWNLNTQQWVVYNKFITDRQVEESRMVKETKSVWFTDDQAGLRYSNTESEISWKNNRMNEVSNVHTNQSGNQSVSTQYFTYDTEGHLVNDSEAVDGFMFWENRYVYDDAGNCISNYLLLNGDTLLQNTYEYTGNKLAHTRNYDYQEEPVLMSEQTYTYDASGNVSESIISGTDEVGFRELSKYEHGYNSEGKLLWMCSFYHEDGEWNKSDSVAMTYTASKADTSYGYVSDDLSTWNSWPSFRFLFDENRVGVKETSALPDLSLYPNPAENHLTVHLKNGAPVTHLLIQDLTGKQVLSQANPGDEIDISGLTKGMYLVQVTSGTQQGVKKLIVK